MPHILPCSRWTLETLRLQTKRKDPMICKDIYQTGKGVNGKTSPSKEQDRKVVVIMDKVRIHPTKVGVVTNLLHSVIQRHNRDQQSHVIQVAKLKAFIAT